MHQSGNSAADDGHYLKLKIHCLKQVFLFLLLLI